jgi:hypothetical protein
MILGSLVIMEIPQQAPPSSFLPTSEAEFLDVIGTKVVRVFLLAILYSHLGFYSSPSPLRAKVV